MPEPGPNRRPGWGLKKLLPFPSQNSQTCPAIRRQSLQSPCLYAFYQVRNRLAEPAASGSSEENAPINAQVLTVAPEIASKKIEPKQTLSIL